MNKQTEALKLALEGAANYIDALGGDSRKYRQALAEQPAVSAGPITPSMMQGPTPEQKSQMVAAMSKLAEQPAQQCGLEMVDDEGENQAVRMFLALYGGQRGITTEQMRKNLKMAGFDGAWPEWANTHNGHLTKAGAQLWIRHLFALEQPAQPAQQQEPVAFSCLRCVTPKKCAIYGCSPNTWPSETPPASKPWVGLTEWEENELWESTDSDWELMKRTEAKLREKNA